MTKLSEQAQKEYAEGYRSGLAGEPEPLREKGRAFWLGWYNGKAEMEDAHANRG